MVIALPLLVLAVVSPALPATHPERNSVLLITLDTTRADHLGSWGWPHAHTPNLDRLAREGARFVACDTASVETLPSHATILTGCYPPRHGVRGNGTFVLPSDFPTLAAALANAGYDTAAVVSAAVLARRFGLDQGFRLYDDDLGRGYSTATVVPERTAEATADAALRVLATLRRPFFLWVHFFDPHDEYRPPPRLGDVMTGSSARYDGEIAYVDEQLGRLLAATSTATTVVVVGDHGEMLGEHGEPTHGILPNRAARRVPLIIRGPGIPAGLTLAPLVRTADLAPTLLAWAGVALPSVLDGESLQGLLTGRSEAPRDSYCEAPLAYYTFRWYPLRTLSTRDFLFVQAPKPSLYDLQSDREERHDLAAANPTRLAELQQRLHRLLVELGEDAALRLPDGVTPDHLTLRQLASLGYLAGASGGAVNENLPDPRQHMDVIRRLADASALVQQGRHADALAALDSIITQAPSGEPIVALRGICLLHLNRPAQALAAFQQASALAPRNPNHLANAAACLTQLGHHAEAFEASQRALALDPGLPEAALQVARQQRAAGLLADAATTLDRAIEAGARTGAVYLERAVLHLTGRRLPEAEAALRQAMERDPTNRIAIERTALVVNELGRYREAAQLFERLVALQPDRSDIWRTLGALYIARLDDPTNAARCFRHALRTERDPRRQQELRALLAELTR